MATIKKKTAKKAKAGNTKELPLLLLCDPGCEAACKSEAEEHGLTITKTHKGLIEATAPDEKRAAKAILHGQTCTEALITLNQAKSIEKLTFPKVADLSASAATIIEGAKTFAVRAKTEKQETNEALGGRIKEAIEKEVNLTKPDVTFVPVLTNTTIFLGLTLTGENYKREYRVFTSRRSLRATVAAAILRLAGYTGNERLLLTYEDDGTLAIEAALMATKKSPFRYQRKLPLFSYWKTPEDEVRETPHKIDAVVPSVQYLKAVQKNAKIAGVHRDLQVTKAELDWLDTKYDKESVQILVAHLPCSGKKRPEKESMKTADDLAYEARYVLAPGGTAAVLSLKPNEHLTPFAKHNLKETGRLKLFMGEQEYTLLLFKKEKKERK